MRPMELKPYTNIEPTIIQKLSTTPKVLEGLHIEHFYWAVNITAVFELDH